MVFRQRVHLRRRIRNYIGADAAFAKSFPEQARRLSELNRKLVELEDALSEAFRSSEQTQDLPLIAKGDILTRDSSENVRLPVGLDHQALFSDSESERGIRWDYAWNHIALGFAQISGAMPDLLLYRGTLDPPGSTLSTWTPIVGEAVTATSSPPVTETWRDNRPCVELDGSADYMEANWLGELHTSRDAGAPVTMVFAVTPMSGGAIQFIAGFSSSTGDGATRFRFNATDVVTVVIDGRTGAAQIISGTVPATIGEPIIIGMSIDSDRVLRVRSLRKSGLVEEFSPQTLDAEDDAPFDRFSIGALNTLDAFSQYANIQVGGCAVWASHGVSSDEELDALIYWASQVLAPVPIQGVKGALISTGAGTTIANDGYTITELSNTDLPLAVSGDEVGMAETAANRLYNESGSTRTGRAGLRLSIRGLDDGTGTTVTVYLYKNGSPISGAEATIAWTTDGTYVLEGIQSITVDAPMPVTLADGEYLSGFHEMSGATNSEVQFMSGTISFREEAL